MIHPTWPAASPLVHLQDPKRHSDAEISGEANVATIGAPDLNDYSCSSVLCL